MKTLDEALDCLIIHAPGCAEHNCERDQIKGADNDGCFDDVVRSDKAVCVVRAIVGARLIAKAGELDIEDVALIGLTLLAAGIRVGSEMNKQELTAEMLGVTL